MTSKRVGLYTPAGSIEVFFPVKTVDRHTTPAYKDLVFNRDYTNVSSGNVVFRLGITSPTHRLFELCLVEGAIVEIATSNFEKYMFVIRLDHDA